MLQKTNTFQSFKKTPFKGNLSLGFPWGWGWRETEALDKLFSIKFCLNQGWAISLALSATSRAKNQERKEDRRSRTRVWKEKTHLVCTGVWGRDHGGNQPPRTSWWQQSFSCFPCPRPEFGHLDCDYCAPEGTTVHSRCLILSSALANLSVFTQGRKSLTV